MTRPASYPTEAQIARAVKGARKAGLDPAGVEIAPDGTLRVLTQALMAGAGSDQDAPEDRPEPW